MVQAINTTLFGKVAGPQNAALQVIVPDPVRGSDPRAPPWRHDRRHSSRNIHQLLVKGDKVSSTRRLRCRPSGVALLAMGFVAPNPAVSMR